MCNKKQPDKPVQDQPLKSKPLVFPYEYFKDRIANSAAGGDVNFFECETFQEKFAFIQEHIDQAKSILVNIEGWHNDFNYIFFDTEFKNTEFHNSFESYGPAIVFVKQLISGIDEIIQYLRFYESFILPEQNH